MKTKIASNCFLGVLSILAMTGTLGAQTTNQIVSKLTGKFDFSTGEMNSHWGDNLSASLSLPVSKRIGLQADGLFTHVGNRDFEGGGLHAFWRDPEKGMLGVAVGGIGSDVLYALQGGVEAEYYLNRFTFGVNVGADTIQYNQSAPFIDTHPTDVFATTSLGYYPMDNVLIQAAYSRMFDNNLGELLLEYQTPVNGLSCFGELAKGDNGYDHALFGLRYYFGVNKSLIRRHREDDPPNLLRRILYTIGTYGAEFNRKANTYCETHPGSDGVSGGYGTISEEGNPPPNTPINF